MSFKDIPEFNGLDSSGFEDLRKQQVPFIMRGLTQDWPLVSAASESVESLFSVLKQMDNGHTQGTIIAPESVDGKLHYNSDYSGQNYHTKAETVSQALDRLLASENETVFLQSISVPDHFTDFGSNHEMPFIPKQVRPRAWIGNKTTVQTHFDLSENIATVVLGQREFTLFPPEQLPNMYLGPLETAPGRAPVSLTNLDDPDFDNQPRFREALKHAQQSVLSPGDAIYIPFGWFHRVEAKSQYNMLVNYWWNSADAQLKNGWAAVLHCLMAFSKLPEKERKVWNNIFDHFVFRQNGDPMEHLPESRRGFLGGIPDQLRTAQIYEILSVLGPEVGLNPPPRK